MVVQGISQPQTRYDDTITPRPARRHAPCPPTQLFMWHIVSRVASSSCMHLSSIPAPTTYNIAVSFWLCHSVPPSPHRIRIPNGVLPTRRSSLTPCIDSSCRISISIVISCVSKRLSLRLRRRTLCQKRACSTSSTRNTKYCCSFGMYLVR